jgi:hypothetical protein
MKTETDSPRPPNITKDLTIQLGYYESEGSEKTRFMMEPTEQMLKSSERFAAHESHINEANGIPDEDPEETVPHAASEKDPEETVPHDASKNPLLGELGLLGQLEQLHS